ncbi:MAG: ankyrin repeat domain-containing protein, partial [Candidatus Babeliales bacterium]
EWIERDALKMLLERASRWFANDPKLYFEYLAKQESLLAWTPLHGAAYGSFSEGIALLITAAKKMFDSRSEEFKAFINLKDNFGRTPLNLCFEIWDRLYIAKHGGIASFVPELEDSYHAILKKDLLKYAAYSGFNKELNEVLRHGIQLYSQPSYKRNTRRLQGVLQEAGLAYDFSRKEFLDFITARDEAGWSPLMNAAADGNAEYVELILRAANAFYKDDKVWVAFIMNNNDTHGRTVWHIAISRRHLDVVKALIRVQKEIAGNRKKPFLRLATHRTELNGFTPLIAAVYESADDNVTFAIIKLLVERAAEVLGKGSREFLSFINRKDYNGYTALSYAVTPRIQKFLKEYGAE